MACTPGKRASNWGTEVAPKRSICSRSMILTSATTSVIGCSTRLAVTTTSSRVMEGWACSGITSAAVNNNTTACVFDKNIFMEEKNQQQLSLSSPTVPEHHGSTRTCRHLVGRYPGWWKQPPSPSQARVQNAQWL